MRLSQSYNLNIVDPFVTYWHPTKVDRAVRYREVEFVLDPALVFGTIAGSRHSIELACRNGVGPTLNGASGVLWRAWCIWAGAPYSLSWASSKKVLWLQTDMQYTPMCVSLHQSLFTMSCLTSDWYRRMKNQSKGLSQSRTARGVEWLVDTEGMSKVGVAVALEQAMPWSAAYGREVRELARKAAPITVRYRQIHDEMVQSITIEGDER